MSEHGEITEGGALRFVRLLPGPIKRVWAWIAEPEKRALWLAGGEIGLVPGARISFEFDHSRITPHTEDLPPEKYGGAGNTEMEGKVLECEPPHLFVFSWPGPGDITTTVTIRLAEADEGQVLLELIHDGIPSWTDLIGASAGWHVHFDIMQAHMEGRVPGPFWAAHTVSEADYEARFAGEQARFAD